MRLLLVELRPSALVQSSLDNLLETLCAATDARDSMVVEAHLVPMPILPPDVQIALYRIAQEGLNNILKHARAAHAVISLQTTPAVAREDTPSTWHGEVVLRVADDGRGFDTSHPPDGRLGLSTMRERAAGIGATLLLESQPGEGTTIEARWIGSSQPDDAA